MASAPPEKPELEPFLDEPEPCQTGPYSTCSKLYISKNLN